MTVVLSIDGHLAICRHDERDRVSCCRAIIVTSCFNPVAPTQDGTRGRRARAEVFDAQGSAQIVLAAGADWSKKGWEIGRISNGQLIMHGPAI